MSSSGVTCLGPHFINPALRQADFCHGLLEDRVLGHSIGWYEGSTLVIDTFGYEAGMLAQHPGLPHSNRLHTVERLTLGESGDTFELTIMAEDALYYTEPITVERSFRGSDQVPREYNCTHPELGH